MHGRVCDAAAAIGLTVWAVELWENKDLYGFKRRKSWAAREYLERIEQEIDRRAIQGIEKPIFNTRGEQTGMTVQYSDNLLMFRAKRLDPAYKDNYDPRPATTPTVTQIVINWPSGVTPPPDLSTVEAEVKELDAAAGDVEPTGPGS